MSLSRTGRVVLVVLMVAVIVLTATAVVIGNQ